MHVMFHLVCVCVYEGVFVVVGGELGMHHRVFHQPINQSIQQTINPSTHTNSFCSMFAMLMGHNLAWLSQPCWLESSPDQQSGDDQHLMSGDKPDKPDQQSGDKPGQQSGDDRYF